MKYKGITIFKRKDSSTWYCRVTINGRQKYISDKTQKGCYNKLKEIINNRENKQKEIINNQTSFIDWYNQWLKLFKINKVKDSTIKNYEYMFKNLNKSFLNKDINKIEAIEIIKILNKINGTRQKQKVYEWLKDIFTKAYLHKIINENIFNIIEKPKHISKKNTALSKVQEVSFINECRKNKYGLFYLICLYQGLRRGECMALTINDFNFENKTLTINKSINEKSQLNSTKNIYSNRVMPLFDRTIKEMEKYNFKNNERLFKVSTKPLHENFKLILSNANLPDMKIHELRHTFITRMNELNIPEHIIQFWVGHEIGSNVTKKVYTHINVEDTLLFNNKVNDKLNN